MRNQDVLQELPRSGTCENDGLPIQHVIVTRDFPESPAPVPARTVWSARATDFVTKVSATVIIFGVERPVTFGLLTESGLFGTWSLQRGNVRLRGRMER